MDVAIIFLGAVAVVFAGSFLSGRRFGVLAVGLAIGSVLSGLWAGELAKFVSGLGVSLPLLPMGVWATAVLLLAPLVTLMTSGPRYHRKARRAVSALGVGVLTAAFLVVPLGQFMVLQGDALTVYGVLKSSWAYVVTAGLVLAVIDLLTIHSGGHAAKQKKH